MPEVNEASQTAVQSVEQKKIPLYKKVVVLADSRRCGGLYRRGGNRWQQRETQKQHRRG